MDSREQTLAPVLSAFPSHFEFYHLGKVELQEDLLDSLQDCSGVAFQIYGDYSAWVVVLFPKDLDSSTYSELGNLLVSKIATQLNAQRGLNAMISPPRLLEGKQLESLLKSKNQIFRKSYAHFCKNSAIPLETWVLPASLEEIGYA